MNHAETSKLVALLMASYLNADMHAGNIAAYEAFLLDLEDQERALAAIKRLVRTSKFLPAIAEIIAAYEALAPRPARRLGEWIPNSSPGDTRPEGAVVAVGSALALVRRAKS